MEPLQTTCLSGESHQHAIQDLTSSATLHHPAPREAIGDWILPARTTASQGGQGGGEERETLSPRRLRPDAVAPTLASRRCRPDLVAPGSQLLPADGVFDRLGAVAEPSNLKELHGLPGTVGFSCLENPLFQVEAFCQSCFCCGWFVWSVSPLEKKGKKGVVVHHALIRGLCIAFWLSVPSLQVAPSFACSVASLCRYPGH